MSGMSSMTMTGGRTDGYTRVHVYVCTWSWAGNVCRHAWRGH